MALAEVARVWNLAEARVAQSALDAAGFTVFVFDEHRGAMVWTEQLALGGIRLMAPADEADDARQLLSQARSSSPPDAAADRRGWGSLATLPNVVACLVFGWPLAGLKQPDTFHRVSALAICTVIGLSAVMGFFIRR
jgi:hypothetical protein